MQNDLINYLNLELYLQPIHYNHRYKAVSYFLWKIRVFINFYAVTSLLLLFTLWQQNVHSVKSYLPRVSFTDYEEACAKYVATAPSDFSRLFIFSSTPLRKRAIFRSAHVCRLIYICLHGDVKSLDETLAGHMELNIWLFVSV